MKIADLFARIGIKADTQKLETFKNQLGNVGKMLGVASLSAAGVSAVLQRITKDAMDAAMGFKQFKAETGASAQRLQRWQAVANETNNSAQAVTGAIKALSANREALKLGKGGNITTFQMLGIDPMDDPFAILEALRTKTAGLAPAMKRNMLAQAGISSELIPVLELSNDQFDAMANRAFIVPPSAINTLDKARGAMERMKNALNFIKTMIGAAVTPNVEKMSAAFTNFVKQNEGRIIQGARKLADLLGKLSKAVFTVLGALDRLIQNTIGYKMALVGLAGVFFMLNSAVLLPVAGIILLFALIEDFVRYSQGKSSAVGLLFDKFPVMEEVFKKLTAPLKELMQLIGAVFSQDQSGIDSILDSWGIWGDIVKKLMENLSIVKDIIGELFTGGNIADELIALTGITGGMKEGGMGEQIVGKIGDSEYLRLLTNPFYALGQLGDKIGGGGANNNVTITVEGSDDPEATAREVGRWFQRATDERAGGIVE